MRVQGEAPKASFKEWSDWSPPATVEAALLERNDFKANFIAAAEQIGPKYPSQPRNFTKKFSSRARYRKMHVYITAFGVCQAYINDKLVSEEEMAPGWTSYKHRLNYRTWTVDSLVPDENEIRVEVAEGWYAGRLGFKGGVRFFYCEEIGAFAQLHVESRLSALMSLGLARLAISRAPRSMMVRYWPWVSKPRSQWERRLCRGRPRSS